MTASPKLGRCLKKRTRLSGRTSNLVAQDSVVVMGGFIGSAPDGQTTTLGRGGSDYSAAIVGAGIGAEEIQIWTDVDGMLTADPRIIPGGHRVKSLSFAEAAEMAYFGAKVLHPATVMPAVERNIPVVILNSRRPEVEGTRITRRGCAVQKSGEIDLVQEGYHDSKHRSTRMLMAHGFLRRIFEIFDRFTTSVDMVSTSEVSVSLTLTNSTTLAAICRELQAFAEVRVEEEPMPGVSGRREHPAHTRHCRPRISGIAWFEYSDDLAGSFAIESRICDCRSRS